MLELIPASAIIAIVVIALIVIFLAVGYVKAPPDMAFIISGIKKKSKIVIGKQPSVFLFLNVLIS